jgi:hypothetical protein
VKRRFPVAVAVAVLLAGTIAFAQGNGKVTQYRDQFPVVGEYVGDCATDAGNFTVLTDYQASMRGTTFADASGHIYREVQSFRIMSSVYYNASDHDKSLPGGPGENEQNQYAFDGNGLMIEHIFSGPAYKIIVPGYGPLFMETGHGRFVYENGAWVNKFNSGHNQKIDGDLVALCEFLK